MSKKTFFRRVAVTAASALGFGLISIVPSQAAISSHTLYIGALSTDTTTSHTTTIAVGETATAVVRHSFLASNPQGESVIVTAARTSVGTEGTLRLFLSDSSTTNAGTANGNANHRPFYSTTGDGSATRYTDLRNAAATVTPVSVGISDTQAVANTTTIASTFSVRFIAPNVAGTYNFTIGTTTYSGRGVASDAVAGPSVTWTVVVTAADVVATAASTSTLRTGEALLTGGLGGTIEGTDSSVIASRLATAGRDAAATIWIRQVNSAGTANESMTVSVSGPAWVSTDSNTAPTQGTAITLRNLGPTGNTSVYSYSGLTPVFVYSTGTAGKATITISTVSGLVLGTETVTFVGSVASIAIEETYRKVLRAGGGANGADQATVYIRAKDANGNPVSGLNFSMISSNGAAVASISTAAATVCPEDTADPGLYDCVASTVATSTSGMATTLTYRVVNPAVTTSTAYFTVDHAVTLGGSASTWTLTANKATYEPGEAMILTATGVDASGNPVSDGTAGPTFLVSNKNLGGTALASVFNTVYDGKSTTQVRAADVRNFLSSNTLFAPVASGKFEISGVYGTGGSKSISLVLTVADDAATSAAAAATDAALEAIDAANAATDAANLAAEAADAATVAAEEARDAADAATAAVEALATEVATLMAALKAQITTLANTVAKIAKKVKA